MDDEIYPWRANGNLADVFVLALPVFESLEVVKGIGGCGEAEIAKAEGRMGRRLPQDVRDFYSVMRPTKIFSGSDRKEFGFYPIDANELTWQSMEEAEPAQDWTEAKGLALGQSTCGDPFWWIEGHRTLAEGSIVLLDHDGGLGGDIMFVYFARSFREFVAKITFFKNLYATQNELFRREYQELNPSAKF